MTYRRTTAIVVIAWLYLVTGAAMLIAPLFAFSAAGGLGPNLAVVPLGALVMTAGVGLLRAQHWAWWLTGAIALSGVVVTAARLWFGGAPEGLVPALVTNLITLAVLARARGSARVEAVALAADAPNDHRVP